MSEEEKQHKELSRKKDRIFDFWAVSAKNVQVLAKIRLKIQMTTNSSERDQLAFFLHSLSDSFSAGASALTSRPYLFPRGI